MKSKDQRVPILLTCGLIILDMNAGNGLAISLSVYLSLSKHDMLKKRPNRTKSKTTKKKGKKPFPPRVVEPQTYDEIRATRYPLRYGHFKCQTKAVYLTFQFFEHGRRCLKLIELYLWRIERYIRGKQAGF